MRKALIITGAAVALAWFLTAWPLLTAGYIAMDSMGTGFGYWAWKNWDAICLYAFAPIMAFILFAGVVGIIHTAIQLLKL